MLCDPSWPGWVNLQGKRNNKTTSKNNPKPTTTHCHYNSYYNYSLTTLQLLPFFLIFVFHKLTLNHPRKQGSRTRTLNVFIRAQPLNHSLQSTQESETSSQESFHIREVSRTYPCPCRYQSFELRKQRRHKTSSKRAELTGFPFGRLFMVRVNRMTRPSPCLAGQAATASGSELVSCSGTGWVRSTLACGLGPSIPYGFCPGGMGPSASFCTPDTCDASGFPRGRFS